MADISKITLPNGTSYDIKDAFARSEITKLASATKWLGATTTELSDGATTNPITIGGESVTATSGDITSYNNAEFIFNGTIWQQFGDLSSLGALAYKDDASADYTPAGTVTASVDNATNTTTTVNSITDVGTLPTASYDSTNEALVFTAGTLPTKGADTEVVTAVGDVNATFAGTQATITVD